MKGLEINPFDFNILYRAAGLLRGLTPACAGEPEEVARDVAAVADKLEAEFLRRKEEAGHEDT